MHPKYVLLVSLTVCGAGAWSQESSDFELAAECAGLSAAISATLAEPAATEPDATTELRKAVAEIHDHSFRRAKDLGAKAGMSDVEVLKRMISAMVITSLLPGDQLRSALKSRCESFRSQPR